MIPAYSRLSASNYAIAGNNCSKPLTTRCFATAPGSTTTSHSKSLIVPELPNKYAWLPRHLRPDVQFGSSFSNLSIVTKVTFPHDNGVSMLIACGAFY